MPPVKPRSRQIEQARFVLVDQPSPLLGGGPILAGNFQRSDEFARLPLDYGKNRAMLRSDYGETPRLSIPAFSPAIFSRESPRKSV
jgi:hypothetical protein